MIRGSIPDWWSAAAVGVLATIACEGHSATGLRDGSANGDAGGVRLDGGDSVSGDSGSGGRGAGGSGAGGRVGTPQVVPTWCASSLDCVSALGRGVCNQASGICVGCLGEADCEAGLTCVGKQCRSACNSDDDCMPRLLCDRAIGRCVDCLVGADCGGDRACQDGSCVALAAEAGGESSAGGFVGTQ